MILTKNFKKWSENLLPGGSAKMNSFNIHQECLSYTKLNTKKTALKFIKEIYDQHGEFKMKFGITLYVVWDKIRLGPGAWNGEASGEVNFLNVLTEIGITLLEITFALQSNTYYPILLTDQNKSLKTGRTNN